MREVLIWLVPLKRCYHGNDIDYELISVDNHEEKNGLIFTEEPQNFDLMSFLNQYQQIPTQSLSYFNYTMIPTYFFIK